MQGVVRIHRNTSQWYQNASVSLPLIGGLLALVIGVVSGSDEAKGFGIFLLAIAGLMVPVVLWSWRSTPTAIVVTASALISRHGDRELSRLPWDEIVEIERKETLGNLRWRVLSREGEHIAIEGEIEDVPGLIEAVKRLSGRSEEEAG